MSKRLAGLKIRRLLEHERDRSEEEIKESERKMYANIGLFVAREELRKEEESNE